MRQLKGLNTIRHVELTGTRVIDAGVDSLKGLAGLAGLDVLWLDHTSVTEAGVKTLQQALPHCKIIR